MIRTTTGTILALLFAVTAHAEPLRLGDAQMDGVTAGQSTMNPYYAITGESSGGTGTLQSSTGASHPVFIPWTSSSVAHKGNTALRFGRGGAIAIPGNAGANANGSSAVVGTKGSSTILRPPGLN